MNDSSADDGSQPLVNSARSGGKPVFKQPRARTDVWAEETKKAREQTAKLLTNLHERNNALRQGQ